MGSSWVISAARSGCRSTWSPSSTSHGSAYRRRGRPPPYCVPLQGRSEDKDVRSAKTIATPKIGCLDRDGRVDRHQAQMRVLFEKGPIHINQVVACQPHRLHEDLGQLDGRGNALQLFCVQEPRHLDHGRSEHRVRLDQEDQRRRVKTQPSNPRERRRIQGRPFHSSRIRGTCSSGSTQSHTSLPSPSSSTKRAPAGAAPTATRSTMSATSRIFVEAAVARRGRGHERPSPTRRHHALSRDGSVVNRAGRGGERSR